MIDFSECEVNPLRAFNGANGPKLSIRYLDHDYVLKFPSHPRNDVNVSYANNCFSEHVACSVLRTIGIDVQETILGTYRRNGKEKIVVACRDFTEGGLRFADFGSLKNMCISSSENGYGTEMNDIENAFDEQPWMDPMRVSSFFWDLFICDALIGNFDRHNGNWGFIIDDARGKVDIAPVFDCASSLFPRLDISDYRMVMDTESELMARVYTWPNSSIKIDDRKINYHDFINSLSHPGCNEALSRICPRIKMDRICDAIDGCEGLMEIQKEFYITILTERKKRILDCALEKLESLD